MARTRNNLTGKSWRLGFFGDRTFRSWDEGEQADHAWCTVGAHEEFASTKHDVPSTEAMDRVNRRNVECFRGFASGESRGTERTAKDLHSPEECPPLSAIW